MSNIKLRGIKYIKNLGPHHLPSEYLELEYILSSISGNCYIDTGIKAQGGVTWEIEHEVTHNSTSWAGVIGCRQQSGEYRYWLIYSGTTYEVGLNTDNTSTVLCQIGVKRKHKQTISEGTTWNWSSYFWNYSTNQWVLDMSNSAPALTTLGNLFLSAVDYTNEGYASMYAYGLKTYECKIYTSTGGVETLARHFIPAIQKSDDAVGMYDLVTSTFFPSNGANPYIAGPICQKECLSLIGKKNIRVVPNEYTLLEYVSDTGNAAFPTDVYMTPTMSVETEVWVKHDSNRWLYGSSENNNFYACNILSNTSLETKMGNSGWETKDVGINLTFNKHTIKTTNTKLYLDNNELSTFSYQLSQTSTDPLNIGARLSNNYGTCFVGYFYTFKVYDGDTLYRNFIPAKRNSDNKIGFYETKTNTFYYSANASGQFTAGPEIPFVQSGLRCIQTLEED